MTKTIYDVAKRAGVGIGTVSRAINNSPQIRPETKKRVLDAVQTIGYVPHTMARRLARRRTNILAAIMPFNSGHFYQELLRGMQQRLSTYNYDLILYYAEDPAKKNIFLSGILQERRCDGVLIVSMDIEPKHIEEFNSANLPLILVDRAQEGVDSIQVENREGAFIATKFLIDIGHRSIGIITGHSKSTPAIQRVMGFKKALSESKLPFQASLLVSADMIGGDTEFHQNDGFNEAVGFAATTRLLNQTEGQLTAIFASADIQAVGAIKAVEKAGLKVPDDISIIGFDDIELAAYLSITTMQQPMFEIGRQSVDLAMSKIEKKVSTIQQIKLTTKLIERGTTRFTAPPQIPAQKKRVKCLAPA